MKNGFDPTPASTSPPAAEPPGVVNIDVPMHMCQSGYAPIRVEIRSLTERQSWALKRLTCSLRDTNARCETGQARTAAGLVVDREGDAVRWLLDQLAAAYESQSCEAQA